MQTKQKRDKSLIIQNNRFIWGIKVDPFVDLERIFWIVLEIADEKYKVFLKQQLSKSQPINLKEESRVCGSYMRIKRENAKVMIIASRHQYLARNTPEASQPATIAIFWRRKSACVTCKSHSINKTDKP